MGFFIRILLILSISTSLTEIAWAGDRTQPSARLTEAAPATEDHFGMGDNNGVALSADGGMALVAAPFAAVGKVTHSGKAYFYRRVDGKWTMVREVDDPDGTAEDYFGNTVTLSADGRRALIGSRPAIQGRVGAGKAYLYELRAGDWVQIHEFDEPSGSERVYFGATAVALSQDGTTASIAADMMYVSGHKASGEVYVYRESGGGWTQTAALPDPDAGTEDYFGYALALSADGSMLLAGSQAAVAGQSEAGKAYLFALREGHWAQVREFDDPAPAAANDNFGDSGVSLSADGKTAIIGADGKTVAGKTGAGIAYIYRAADDWSRATALADPDATAGDSFAYPMLLSVDGDSVLIGSGATVAGKLQAGKAYLYRWDGSDWNKAREFDDPMPAEHDRFGFSGFGFSRDLRTVFISAYGSAQQGVANAGAVYIYDNQ